MTTVGFAKMKLAAGVAAAVMLTGTLVAAAAAAPAQQPQSRQQAVAPAKTPTTSAVATARGQLGEIDADMAAMLAKKLPEIAIDRVPARDVIDLLRDVTNANIFLNWRTLEVAGVTRQQPVTLRLREVSLRTVLWLLLDAAQAKPDTPLDFRVEKEVITISTAPDIALSENSAAGPATQKSPATAPRR